MHSVTSPSELMDRLQAALGSLYRLERELGHGGMGVVFLARDTTLDRPVAVKVVHPELAVHSAITQRFLAEARMIARLRHPGIVAVHTAGEATGLVYYVMDYVAGESLRQRLLREGKLSITATTAIVADLADALHAAGEAGLVHRDVKPENILLDSASGRAMLADFGIARVMAGEVDGARTAQGVAVGTPTYMSPEQAAGDVVDARSDLYALGVVAYEMLAGQPPFRGLTGAVVASKHLAERATPIASIRTETPPALAHAITRALEKDPGARWQTGADLRRAVLGQSPVPATAATRQGRRVALVLVGLALVAAATFAMLRPGGPPSGVNPRHSILVLPFDNLRRDPAVDWLRDGSVSMLTLNLSQWNDLTVVDHERLHDLLERRTLDIGQPIGLAMARQLARDAGVWTVVLGEFTRAGDSLQLVARVYDVTSGARLDVAQAAGTPGQDVRPLFDALAAKLLNLSGAPTGLTTDLAHATTTSLEAYRAYLAGIDELNRWNLAAADRSLRHAVQLDSSFGLAYYKLSLTRGWIAGQFDPAGLDAIHRATQHADRLPAHDRAMIEAYRNFLEGDFTKGRAGYQALLARDSTDADAWYALGDVDFHDPRARSDAALLGASLRAFKKAIALDADYYLAFEHLAAIYRSAAADSPMVALLPGDSLVSVKSDGGRAGLESGQIAAAVQRARAEGIASARAWLAHQPENVHAQNALIFALAAARQFDAALATVDRLAQDPASRWRADLPFVRAQVLTEQRELEEAVRTVARALDSATTTALSDGRLSGVDALGAVGNGANAAGYLGRVAVTTRALDLFSEISATLYPESPGSQRLGEYTLLGHLWHSHIYTVLGAPAAKLRPIWEQVADSARRAPRLTREGVVNFGWVAALGLYLQNRADPTPLNELQALGGGATPPELMALQAIERGDSTEARRQLSLPDSMTAPTYRNRPQWWAYKHMIAANAWRDLGDDRRALQALDVFQTDGLYSGTVDLRWLLAGQARMLRGEIYEHQGKRELARTEYQQALAQWDGADTQLDGLVAELRLRLSRVG